MGFVVDEVAQGQVLLRAALFFPSHYHSTIAPFSSSSQYYCCQEETLITALILGK
jgi:hypothetical protein